MNQTTEDNDDAAAKRVSGDTASGDNAIEAADAAFEPDREEVAEPSGTGSESGEAPAAPPRRGVSALVAWIALLLGLAALTSSGFVAWQNRSSGDDAADNEAAIAALSGQIGEAVGALEARQQAALSELGNTARQTSQRIDSLQRELDEALRQNESIAPRLGNLEDAVSSLQGVSAGVRDTWMLAEAEYYMQIANAQLQLAGNPQIAAMALGFAEERVRQMANPALSEVRRALTRELQTLESMETADLEGMTLALASLAERVESLPLNESVDVADGEAAPIDPELSGFRRAIASMKRAFGDIVSVRRTDEELAPLLSPDAAYFLRANLALQFQAARLALLKGEQGIFEQLLDEAAGWLREYYDADSSAVAGALETIADLKDRGISTTLPDISGSLRLLRQYRTLRDAGSPGNDESGDADTTEPVL
jgi:uroporphyrin-3 C-methyltransferase